MKIRVLLIIMCSFLFSCDLADQSEGEPIANMIVEHLRNNCPKDKACRVNLSKITDFTWDTLFVFHMAVEGHEITRITGKQFTPSSSENSNKMVFLEKGRIVRTESHTIPQVDKPFNDGDLDFEIPESDEKYAIFSSSSLFEVEEINTGSVTFYRLHCVNC